MSPADRRVVDVRDRFAPLRAALLALLDDLATGDWRAPTACTGWDVHDVAAHMLGGDIGILSADRDGHRAAPGPDDDLSSFDGLVAFIDRRNAEWVAAMRRVSPRLIRDLLAQSGSQVEAVFTATDLAAPGHAVDWAGPGPQPAWVHIAREYTERWTHQQHIRDATGRPGLTGPEWLHPALDTFLLALPHTLRDISAGDGAGAGVIVTGPAGGAWWAVRSADHWRPAGARPCGVVTTVTLDEDTAWQWLTAGLPSGEVRRRAHIDGDAAVGGAILRMVSILA